MATNTKTKTKGAGATPLRGYFDKMKEAGLDPDKVWLAAGGHQNPKDGYCALELASILAGQPFSDSPACVSPVLRLFVIGLNDRLSDEERQKLVPYIPRLLGTIDKEPGRPVDKARNTLITGWLLHDILPALLTEVAEGAKEKHPDHARKLRAAAEKCRATDAAAYYAAYYADATYDAADDAAAAYYAAYDADATYDAAYYAAYDAAEAAAAAAADAHAYAYDAAYYADAASAYDAAAAYAHAAAHAAAAAYVYANRARSAVYRALRALGIQAIVEADKLNAPYEERQEISRARIAKWGERIQSGLWKLLDDVLEISQAAAPEKK